MELFAFRPCPWTGTTGNYLKWFAGISCYMVRRTFMQRGHLAARRVIHGDCLDRVPEIQLSCDSGDAIISNRGLDGTVLHDFVLVQSIKAGASSLDAFPCPMARLGGFQGSYCFHFGVMELFGFQPFSQAGIRGNYSKSLADARAHTHTHI